MTETHYSHRTLTGSSLCSPSRNGVSVHLERDWRKLGLLWQSARRGLSWHESGDKINTGEYKTVFLFFAQFYLVFPRSDDCTVRPVVATILIPAHCTFHTVSYDT